MIKEMDLTFCNLIYLDTDNFITLEKNLLSKAYKINKKIFDILIPKFDVQFVYSRKELNKLWGEETPNYMAAFVKEDDKIVILAYSVFDKESMWKKEDFFKALIHEINHLFYQELRDDSYDPLWLSEGLATFMQNSRKTKKPYTLKIRKEILEQKSEETTLESYEIFTMFVKYLILKYGMNSILDLIKGLKSGEDIDTLFQRLFKKSFAILIRDGNNYYKIT